MENTMNDTKPWYMSRTVWGALVAIAASIGGAFGIMITEADQIEIADTALQLVGTVGGFLALYGRLSAQKIIS